MSEEKSESKKWLTTGKLIVATVIAFLGWFLSGSNQILSNLSSMPHDISSLSNQVKSWYYDDELWTGVWSTDTEYMLLVDESTVSSGVDFKLDLVVTQGKVSGTISSRKICELMPLIDGTLIEGEVDGDSIRAVVYEIISNKRVNLALIRVNRNSGGIIVEALEDPISFVPDGVKAIKQPNEKQFLPFCQHEFDARRKGMGSVG
ncbi:hypothetical protein ND924_22735 [Vibrio diabolicus]|uniref:hypothetical protein n=1 Tax=Vibrio diabolicus TaxID=50719 RepID=UPI002160CC72|nr:hypothetical protein [Vibrio diabolicus]MCS0305436.1 hypothetical protein [Vibrio diabolicus]